MKQRGNRTLALFLAFAVTASFLSGIPAAAADAVGEPAAAAEADGRAGGQTGAESGAADEKSADAVKKAETGPVEEEAAGADPGAKKPEAEEAREETGVPRETEAREETGVPRETGAGEEAGVPKETGAGEETEAPGETEAAEEPEETEGTEPPRETEIEETVETEETAETKAETNAETEAEKTEQGTKVGPETAPELSELTAADASFAETAAEPERLLAAQLPAERAAAGVRLLKADRTEFAMFVVSSSTAEIKDGEIAVTISTENTGYDALYLGNRADEPKTPLVQGTEKDGGGWDFAFTVPLEKNGQDIPVCIRSRKSGSWYAKADLILTIPELETEPEPEPGPAPEPEPKPEPAPDPEPVPEQPVPGQASENTYDVVEVESDAAMFKVTDCVLTEENGKTKAVITLSGTGYDYLYLGSAADAAGASATEWIPFAENGAGAYTYTLPAVELDRPVAVAAHSKKKDQWYDRTLTFRSETRKRIAKEGDYGTEVESSVSMFRVVNCVLTAKDGAMDAVITLSGMGYDYLFMGTAQEAASADSSEWIPSAENGEGAYTYEIPVSALDAPIAVAAHSKKNDRWYDRSLTFRSGGMRRTVKDGTYQVPVQSDSSMFRVTGCVLTAEGGRMIAVLTLGGTGYDRLYLGTAKQAAADPSGWISFAEGEGGACTYTVSVPALDTPVQVAAHSKKKDQWYDRTLVFQTKGMERLSDGSNM